MARQQLRAVRPDEKPAAKGPPKTLTEAIDGGSYLEILKAQRRLIVRTLPEAQGPAAAALHRQLSLLSKEIETLQIVAASESVVADTPDARFDYSQI